VPTNAEVAATFREIADLLDVLGETFKPEAYRRAARSIESLSEPLGAVEARGELRTIPGVGEAIAEKIRELLSTGTIAYRDRLLHEVPPGLLEIVRLPGLGPKTARRFWVELGIEGPAELRAAIEAGRLDGVKGFGPKKIAQIRAALAPPAGTAPSPRRPIEEVYPIAVGLVEALRRDAPVRAVEIAGSFRRGQETVGDLDVLATSAEPERVFDAFSKLPEIREVRLRGGTKETVVLSNGLQVDLRVVEPDAFGAALQYFTGSKDHNVALRTLARDRGLKINEYGVFRGETRIAGRTEAEVYATLGLAWIPPELRVDRGEIALAGAGTLPTLVTAADLVADLHVHLPADAAPADLDGLRDAARAQQLELVGVVAGGIGPDGRAVDLAAAVRARLRELGKDRPRLVAVEELATGAAPGDAGSGAYRLLRADAGPPPTGDGPTARGLVHLGTGGRPDGALLPWFAWAASRHLPIEVGPGPDRLDSNGARAALEAHAALLVPRSLRGGPLDPTGPVALAFARRAGARPQDVGNARPERRATGRAGPTR